MYLTDLGSHWTGSDWILLVDTLRTHMIIVVLRMKPLRLAHQANCVIHVSCVLRPTSTVSWWLVYALRGLLHSHTSLRLLENRVSGNTWPFGSLDRKLCVSVDHYSENGFSFGVFRVIQEY
jgi:hypothetical protein